MSDPISLSHLVLTESQINTVIGSLYQTLTETEVHLASYRDCGEPKATDVCCDAHRAIFDERKSQRETLQARLDHVKTLIRQLQRAEEVTGDQDDGTSVELDPAHVTLLYVDRDENRHEQPLADVTTSGTLIDPDSGDDLEITAARITLTIESQDDGWANSIPRELADALLDREDEESERAAEWLAEHENDDVVWNLIGPLLDQITEMADQQS